MGISFLNYLKYRVSEFFSFDLFVRICNLCFGFAFGLLLTRFLSPESRGHYALFVNYSIVNSIVLAFGFPDFLLKYSRQVSINNSLKNYVVIFIVLLSIVGIFNFFFVANFFFAIVVFSILQLLSLLFRYYLYVAKSILCGELFQLSVGVVNLIGVFLIYLCCPENLGLIDTWMNISIITIVLILVIFCITLKLYEFRIDIEDLNFSDIRLFFNKLSGFGVVSMSGIISGKALYFFLSSYQKHDLIAKFSVSEIVSSVLGTFFSVITVKYALILYNSKKNHFNTLIIFLSIIFFTSLPAILLLFVSGGRLFSFVYGDAYRLAGDLSYLQVIIACLSAISSFIVILNISIGVVYQNAFVSIIFIMLLCLYRLFFDELGLMELYRIIISLNLLSILFLSLLYFKSEKGIRKI